jgi:hypothetical protein
MPVGITDFAGYMQFLSAAPELNGRWELAPIPGRLKEDGTIDRSC